jgi:putative ABC transport system substrate-binding protein
MMKRRDFITLLGSAAAAWPLAARAQQERIRRIGVLAALTEDDLQMQAQLAGFRQALELLGWSDGRNMRLDYRFARANVDHHKGLAKELVALQPDVILAHLTPVASALKSESQTIPIVFVGIQSVLGS